MVRVFKGVVVMLSVLSAAAAIGLARNAGAEDPSASRTPGAERNERCATRLAVAITGESASPELLGAADPQAKIDDLLGDPRFAARYASFVNAQFNDGPGEMPEDDAPFFLAREILSQGKPWKDLFLGPYRVVASADGKTAEVKPDADGVGYFRSPAWLIRYAGNEQAGIKISTAYHMMQNTVGLDLTAVTNSPDVDISATGRQAPACAGCHFSKWFALDKVASVLSRRVDEGAKVRFEPNKDGPQQILGGITIADDKELITALVNSQAFDVQTCRLAFHFLYGRDENKCEGELFDRCMDAFRAKGTLQSAIATVAKDASFCE